MSDENRNHLLSFATDSSGQYVAVHLDLEGVGLLIEELENLRAQLIENDCPHTHLFGYGPLRELTTTKLASQANEVNQVFHVKIYGWNEEWAVKHKLKPPAEAE